MITPTKMHQYYNIPSLHTNWSQYCTRNPSSRSPRPSYHPDLLYLLTRDLPIPSLDMKDEVSSTMRVAKWRNSKPKEMLVWQAVFNPVNIYTSEFIDSILQLFCRYILWKTNFSLNLWVLITSTLNDAVKMASTTTISPARLTELILTFEMALEIRNGIIHDKILRSYDPLDFLQPCVRLPIRYASNLKYRDDLNAGSSDTHRKLVLLLARDLMRGSPMRRLQRLNEVLGMIWLMSSPNNEIHIDGQYSSSESLQDLGGRDIAKLDSSRGRFHRSHRDCPYSDTSDKCDPCTRRYMATCKCKAKQETPVCIFQDI